MSDEAAEAQLVLPKKVYQSTPMFDNPISSASEDESRIGRATLKGKVVMVPLQYSMRLPEAPTSVITMSRTANTSVASTSNRVSTGNYAL